MGQGLSDRLIDEGHSVTVIDRDPAKIEHITTNYDVMACRGNGADYEVLTEAGAEDADLLLAVTDDDAVNMLCCLTARKLGSKQHGRPCAHDGVFPPARVLQGGAGASPLFSTPSTTPRLRSRVSSASPRPPRSSPSPRAARKWWEFTVTQEMPICGLKLSQLGSRYGSGILVSAVQHGPDVVIPPAATAWRRAMWRMSSARR